MEVRAVIIYSCCLFHLWILSPKTENSVLQDCAISGRKWKDSQCAKSCVPNWDLWGSKKPSKRIPTLSHSSWLAAQKVGDQLARSWNPNLLLWVLTVMQFVVVVIVAASASSSAFTICNSRACWWWWISGWPELVVVGISCWSSSDWRSPCNSMSLQALLLPLPATQIRQQQICWCILKHCCVSSIAKDGFGWWGAWCMWGSVYGSAK